MYMYFETDSVMDIQGHPS